MKSWFMGPCPRVAGPESLKANRPAITADSKKHMRFPTPIEAALYRIVQEALTNSRRQAKPCHVIIGMQREAEAFHCLVTDGGIRGETKAPIYRKCQQGPNCWAFKLRSTP